MVIRCQQNNRLQLPPKRIAKFFLSANKILQQTIPARKTISFSYYYTRMLYTDLVRIALTQQTV